MHWTTSCRRWTAWSGRASFGWLSCRFGLFTFALHPHLPALIASFGKIAGYRTAKGTKWISGSLRILCNSPALSVTSVATYFQTKSLGQYWPAKSTCFESRRTDKITYAYVSFVVLQLSATFFALYRSKIRGLGFCFFCVCTNVFVVVVLHKTPPLNEKKHFILQIHC